ncbi:hypothetical protein [Pyxidicoccus trucidator]|uniref:hypothetical protein n=1 Tax=Pyxidicoccus trucidator TaxID=2709662 RepID=UPI0013DCAE1B|nr:hypothetical protein [Pyxidicoccus trucidator]
MNIYKGLLMSQGYLTRVDLADDAKGGPGAAEREPCPPPGGRAAALRGGPRSVPVALSGEAAGLACGCG